MFGRADSESAPRRRSVQPIDADMPRRVVEKYDLTLHDIFDVQDEIGRQVPVRRSCSSISGPSRAVKRYSPDR